MCGICGIIYKNDEPVNQQIIRNMMKRIKHRGPNDDGVFSFKNIHLGFVRLSIIDLSIAGHQPMISNDGNSIIVFNGEIFNYIELREELILLGYTFKTKTDTEVLLYSYIHWGEKCLHKLNGMWAFAIYNKQKHSLFISRDRYGIKPLYFWEDSEKYVFASEIPAITEVAIGALGINHQMVFDYLAFNRTDHTKETFFRGIFKVGHGECIIYENKNIIQKKWYDLRKAIDNSFINANEYLECLTSSISLRLRSDVPIGVCLSGGVDSSSIVSIISQKLDKSNLNTFSAVYGEGKKGDETKYIQLFKNSLPNMHFIFLESEMLFNNLDDFIKAHAEPVFTTSQYAQYKIMEYAKNFVTVTLDGQGADEQLGGYEYFYSYNLKGLLNNRKLFRYLMELYYYLVKNYSHYGLYAIKYFVFLMLPEYLKIKSRTSSIGFINPEFENQYNLTNQVTGTLYSSSNLHDALLNHFEYKLEHLLKWEDNNSMRFSIEARVPFLDHRLVEQTLALPSNMLIHNGETKYILREALKGILPETIRIRRDKIGFETPEDEWFRSDRFKNLIQTILNEGQLLKYNFIDVERSRNLYAQHLARKINISKIIWKWINIEKWIQNWF